MQAENKCVITVESSLFYVGPIAMFMDFQLAVSLSVCLSVCHFISLFWLSSEQGCGTNSSQYCHMFYLKSAPISWDEYVYRSDVYRPSNHTTESLTNKIMAN
jgi:hypothetical protein